MESRMIVLFCTLLSLFLFFSVASAIWLGFRRHGRLPSVVWGVLFLLPLLPFSPLAYGLSLLSVHTEAPIQVQLTVNAAEERVVSLLSAKEDFSTPAPLLTLSDTGEILRTKTPLSAWTYDKDSYNAILPEGVAIPGWLWDMGIFLITALLFLWSMSAAAHVIYRVSLYVGNIHFLTSRSVVCRDERLTVVFDHVVKQVKLLRKPEVRVVEEGVALSPCTAGLFTPTVYISHRQATMAADELEYIFLHELCHVKRHDFLTKLLALLATSVYSFSPFADHVRKQVYGDCELGCDRMVLSHIGPSRRDRYLATILTIAEETMVHRKDTEKAVVNGELFSFAAAGSAKELLLCRFKSLRQEEKPASVLYRCNRIMTVLLLCVTHVLLFVLTDTTPMADPMVQLESTYLETVLREYYDLPSTEPLHMSHLSRIYALDFTLSRKLQRDNPLLVSAQSEDGGKNLALCCLVNEGKYPITMQADGDYGAVLERIGMQDWLADGITPTVQDEAEALLPIPHPLTEPIWLDRDYNCAVDLLPDVCPLSTLSRYLPADEALCQEILQHYTPLDGTTGALDAYAAEIYKAVIEENNLSVDAPEAEITAAFARYCAEHGITLDTERGDILLQVYSHRQTEVLTKSPAALFQPMVFLDPTLTGDEVETLAAMLLSAGVTGGKVLADVIPDATGRFTVDFADLVLFDGLRTVILDDRLTLAEEVYGVLTGKRCSVIEK